MPMTENGISTTTAPGQEQHEYFRGLKMPGKPAPKLCQYDYRHTDGELFSCIDKSVDACRARRDEWLSRKTG